MLLVSVKINFIGGEKGGREKDALKFVCFKGFKSRNEKLILINGYKQEKFFFKSSFEFKCFIFHFWTCSLRFPTREMDNHAR